MENSSLEQKIINRGKEFFASISGEAPSIFNKGWWMGKVMDWSMNNETFKVQLFRFIDVFPVLRTPQQIHAVLSFTQMSAPPATMTYYTLMATDLVVDTPGYFEGG